jgi:RNA-binding protein
MGRIMTFISIEFDKKNIYKTVSSMLILKLNKRRFEMLTGKQKRYLRSLGNELEPILTIGKGGISENVVTQADQALEARELFKARVLPNCLEEPENIAKELAMQVNADVAQVIGRNFLLYRASKKKALINFPL